MFPLKNLALKGLILIRSIYNFLVCYLWLFIYLGFVAMKYLFHASFLLKDGLFKTLQELYNHSLEIEFIGKFHLLYTK